MKTVFSRTNAMVRQFIRSAIRDWAVCRIGAVCPRSRPATTTLTTPEECSSSETMNVANGTTSEIAVSSTGSVRCLRIFPTQRNATKPISAPPTDATRKSKPTRPSATVPAPAAIAVRSATRAVASLRSDSPSRIVTILRGRPIRRPIVVAATASGGATTAPIASATHQSIPGSSACTSRPMPKVVNTTRPTLSRRMGRRLALKSTSDVWIAAAYSSGGSSPSRTTSELRWTVGRPGTYDAATPTTISPSGAGKETRSATAVPASTTIARATSSNAISTRTFLPCRRGGVGSRPLRDPSHGVTPAELVMAEARECEHDDRPAVRRKGEHVGDHPAVGEDLGAFAERVHEGVVDAALVADLAHVGEVARALDPEATAQRAERLMVLDAPVVVAGRHRGVSHAHLSDQPAQQRPDSLSLVVVLDDDLLVEVLLAEVAGDPDQLPGQPQVMLDHLLQQVWSADHVTRRQPDAGRRHEMHAVHLPDLDVARLLAPLPRRHVVGLGERAGEGFVRGVARLQGDVQQRRPRRDHPVRRAFEQDAPSQRLWRLAPDGLDHPIEVEAREVVPRRPVLTGCVVVIQGGGEPVDELGEGVGGAAHGSHGAPPSAATA